MTVGALLAELRRREIGIWMEADRLRVSAPAGTLTPELTEELRLRKAELVEILREAETGSEETRAVVPLQPNGTRTPIFAIPGHNGDVFCYRALARRLGSDQPFFALQPPGADDHAEPMRDIEALAAFFAAQVRRFRPNGPYVLAGYCAGGAMAFELARQLDASGPAVEFVVMFTAPFPYAFRRWPELRDRIVDRLEHHAREFAPLSNRERLRYLRERWDAFRARRSAPAPVESDPVMLRRAQVEEAALFGLRRYEPRYYEGRLRLFTPNDDRRGPRHTMLRWRHIARDTREYAGPAGGIGDAMLLEPQVEVTALTFERCREDLARPLTPDTVGATSRSTAAPTALLPGSVAR